MPAGPVPFGVPVHQGHGGIRLKRFDEHIQVPGEPLVVIVAPRDVRATARRESDSAGTSRPQSGGSHDPYAPMCCLHCRVAAVVYDDDLAVRTDLGQHGRHGTVQQTRAITGADDHAGRWALRVELVYRAARISAHTSSARKCSMANRRAAAACRAESVPTSSMAATASFSVENASAPSPAGNQSVHPVSWATTGLPLAKYRHVLSENHPDLAAT